MAKAEGSHIWDDKGKKLIDFTSGWNVTNLGWNHPEVNEAVAKQAMDNVYCPMWAADESQESAAAELLKHLPSYFDTVIKTTSGTESVEVSIKLARVATGRKKILGYKNTYHGQLFAAMALGFPASDTNQIGPMVPDIIQMDYPNGASFATFIDQLDQVLSKREVAALITEPEMITGWGSSLVAPQGYLKKIRELTQKYGTLLIVDEVGTGFGRLGKMFGIEYSGITPDVMTFAKGMSNGSAAIGAVVTNQELVEPTIPLANYTSTFGWTPIACAGIKKSIEIHSREKYFEQVEGKSKLIKAMLQDSSLVKEIRGIGLEIGVSFNNIENLLELENIAFENGLHIINGGEGFIQLMPPLIIDNQVLKEGLNILLDSAQKIIQK